MSSLPLGFISQSNSSPRVNNGWFLDDKTITLKTGNVTTRVGK